MQCTLCEGRHHVRRESIHRYFANKSVRVIGKCNNKGWSEQRMIVQIHAFISQTQWLFLTVVEWWNKLYKTSRLWTIDSCSLFVLTRCPNVIFIFLCDRIHTLHITKWYLILVCLERILFSSYLVSSSLTNNMYWQACLLPVRIAYKSVVFFFNPWMK